MSVRVQREGATPNLLKYSIVADAEGGDLTLTRDELIAAGVKGPLRQYLERANGLADHTAACRYLLCNASMRVFLTPQTLARLAVDARSATGQLTVVITAEANAAGILALEFRHSLSA